MSLKKSLMKNNIRIEIIIIKSVLIIFNAGLSKDSIIIIFFSQFYKNSKLY